MTREHNKKKAVSELAGIRQLSPTKEGKNPQRDRERS